VAVTFPHRFLARVALHCWEAIPSAYKVRSFCFLCFALLCLGMDATGSMVGAGIWY